MPGSSACGGAVRPAPRTTWRSPGRSPGLGEGAEAERFVGASVAEWPTDSLWLAGHRAMREVPRVAAVWKFLAEELRRAMAPRRG